MACPSRKPVPCSSTRTPCCARTRIIPTTRIGSSCWGSAAAIRWPEDEMRKNYDFSTAVRNPYAKRLKRQLTIRLDEETISYFQGLAREMSLPYQTLMNMYLRDCAETRK